MVIVIDHNVVCALAIQAVLSDMHFKTLAVHDAYAGLRICSELQRDVEFVFVNLLMTGLNGFQLIRHIKYVDKKIPVFAYAGEPTKKILQRCKETGFDGFIQKPINYHRLSKFIKKYNATKDQKGQEYSWD